MSYQEKRTVTSLISGAVIITAYCLYVFTGNGPGAAGTGDLGVWAETMLIFTGIAIGMAVIMQILFHIGLSISVAVREQQLDEKEIGRKIEASIVEDEMDKLIELKSSRIGWAVTGAGFAAGLLALVLGGSAVLMLNLVFLCICAGTMTGGLVSIYYYRKGVKNG